MLGWSYESPPTRNWNTWIDFLSFPKISWILLFMARLFSRQTRKFLKSIWITFNYMLEYVFWCYNVRGDLRAPFRAGFHQKCTIGKLPLVVFSHWVLSWQLSSTGRELTTFVSKKNTSLLPIHKAYTNFFVKLFWFIQPVCFLPSLHLLRWSELRPEDLVHSLLVIGSTL